MLLIKVQLPFKASVGLPAEVMLATLALRVVPPLISSEVAPPREPVELRFN